MYANTTVVEEEKIKELETFEESVDNSQWMKVIEEEIIVLKQNQTWDLVLKLKDEKPKSCKWVYKIKRHPDSLVERYKVWLVTEGFSQQYGLEYDETFSPIAKLSIVRVLFALALSKE